jgi:hypothetical protein
VTVTTVPAPQPLSDHTIRITESVNTVRDLLAGVLETYLSQTSNRLLKQHRWL